MRFIKILFPILLGMFISIIVLSGFSDVSRIQAKEETITEAWVDDDWNDQADVDSYNPALIWQTNAFSTVVQAVDAVTNGAVHVLAGTYTETLILNNSIEIYGEEGPEKTILQAANAPGIAKSRVVKINSGTQVTLEGLTIRYGRAIDTNGGGYGGGINNLGNLVISNTHVISNYASTYGGGIYSGSANNGGTYSIYLNIHQSTISGNTSGTDGGGLYIDGTYHSTYNAIAGSTFIHNTAADTGGAIKIFGTSLLAGLNIQNSTISNNSATNGGGIANIGAAASLVCIHCTLSENYASNALGNTGGNIGNFNGNILLRNSILADNLNGNDCASNTTVTFEGSNIVEDDTCGFSGGTDPKLGSLQDNGGSTWTHALLPGSPAIDAILSGECTNEFDQRGVIRPQEAGCDIGAYEVISEVWVDDDWHNQTDVDAYNPSLTWGSDSFNSIGEGIDIVIGSVVHVLTGTYTERLTIDKSVEIIGEMGPENTILQAANTPGIATSRVITISDAITVSIDGLTIRYGFASGSGYDRYGGGIDNQGTLTLTNSLVYSNTAEGKGGGIYNNGSYGKKATLNIFNSTISDNSANWSGGGIYNDSYYGSATTRISQSILAENSSGDGGGIYNDGEGSINALLIIDLSTFDSNFASDEGGGLYSQAYDGGDDFPVPVTITRSTFSNNIADSGGGICQYGTYGIATMNISQSTISDNSADRGGGIHNSGSSGGSTIYLLNSTLSNNSATDGDGGGIYSDEGTNGTIIITATHTTFWGNSATQSGGGIWSYDGTFVFSSTIIAGSTSGGDCAQNVGSTIIDDGYNIIEDNTCGFTGGYDPKLGSLQDNGGPTWTHALLTGSPAIDAIPNGVCKVIIDQRGFLRPQGNGCDIGAYEAEPGFVIYIPLVLK